MSVAAKCVNSVCVCLLPNTANNFRPLALRHRPLAAVSTLLITAKVLAIMLLALTPTPAELATITTARIVQLTNEERTKAGLAPLAVNAQLTSAAQEKGQHMLQEDYFAHISPSGVTPWFWINKAGYTYTVAGENLAIDFVEAEDVVAAWIASPTHKDNMLHSAYTETGVAVVSGEFQGGTSTIVVHMFGKQPGTPTPAPTPSTAGSTAPTPTPQPPPTPAPSPTPVPAPPADTVPPRTPRIALVGSANTVQSTVTVEIEAESGSTVEVFVNQQQRARILVATSEPFEITIDLATLPDGTLTLRAQATDAAGNTSDSSPALALAKDTEGPQLAHDAVSFVLSPATDAPQALAILQADEYANVTIATAEATLAIDPARPIVISDVGATATFSLIDEYGNAGTGHEFTLVPQFSQEPSTDYLTPPARLSRTVRLLTASIIACIVVLLALAVFIRVSIQRPALITHTSLVLLLAAALLFI